MNKASLRMMLIGAVLTGLSALPAQARIDGVAHTSFTLTARTGFISIPDGSRPFMWGYALDRGPLWYPGPTLLVTQGASVTVTLVNTLATTTSVIFPGQRGVTALRVSGPARQGILTLEAGPGGVVQYRFPAPQPGTYLYHSGTRPDLQIEMGLVGALIVRPAAGGVVQQKQAYNHADSTFDHECLFLATEMDPEIHALVQQGKLAQVDTAGYSPRYWFLNGRCAPDTMAGAYAGHLPSQPYNCQPVMEPGQKLLLRVIGGGREQHPFRIQGNHARLIARDGRMLSSAPGKGADLAREAFTIPIVPGGTADAIFTWTGQGLGWDIFGHKPSDPRLPFESAADHGKPFPVKLPAPSDAAYGDWYGGSPFLGAAGPLPPGQGGVLNSRAGYATMWHSSKGKELTNDGIYPGGMMTILVIQPPGTMAVQGGK